MLQCWEEVAESRPRFNDISQSVDAMLVERSDYLCFDMEGECEVRWRPQSQQVVLTSHQNVVSFIDLERKDKI